MDELEEGEIGDNDLRQVLTKGKRKQRKKRKRSWNLASGPSNFFGVNWNGSEVKRRQKGESSCAGNPPAIGCFDLEDGCNSSPSSSSSTYLMGQKGETRCVSIKKSVEAEDTWISEAQEENVISVFHRRRNSETESTASLEPEEAPYIQQQQQEQQNQQQQPKQQQTKSQTKLSVKGGPSGRKNLDRQGWKKRKLHQSGFVVKVITDKLYGFIRPLGGPENTETSEADIYFNFENVRGYLFELKKGDTVEYSVIHGRKGKTSAVNVVLMKPVHRTDQELQLYLEAVSRKIDESLEVEEGQVRAEESSFNVAQIVGTPILWQHLSNMISLPERKDLELLREFVQVIQKLSQVSASFDESYKQVLSAATSPSFFNPFRGRLKELIETADDEQDVEMIQHFLLLVVKHAPDKACSAVALAKPIVETDASSNKFLYEMLKTVSQQTSANIDEVQWEAMPLTMTTAEVHSAVVNDEMNLHPVICKGAYQSPYHYIETYFRLLRADCFASLKKGIQEFLNGKLDKRDMNIYVNVVLTGIEVKKDHLYFALELPPPQRGNSWDSSRYLMYGNLLCLSLGRRFDHLIWATVADRSLLKMSNTVLVQMCYEFNMNDTDSELITETKDCSKNEMITINDFINSPYDEINSVFDESQEAAVKLALRSDIGIIQGPPGSGKTFIGIEMLRIILSLPSIKDKKVLLLTYKNHALDEFVKAALNYFPNDIVRIGGGSTDPLLEMITLKSIKRDAKKKVYGLLDQKNSIYNELAELKGEIEECFDQLNESGTFSVQDIFSRLSAEQLLNLIKGYDWDSRMNHWIKNKVQGVNATKKNVIHMLNHVTEYEEALLKLAEVAFAEWMPKKEVFPQVEMMLRGSVSADIKKLDHWLDNEHQETSTEENDHYVDDEEMREMEEERRAALPFGRDTPDEKREIHRRKKPTKSVDQINLFSRSVCRKLVSEGFDALLHYENLWDLTLEQRVCFMQCIASDKREKIRSGFDKSVKLFNRKANKLSEIQNTETVFQLNKKQILAMTITGASIHNTLLKVIRPEIVVVEEAAEILEPQLVAAIGSWAKYLLLIGDHYQLRPSVETYELKKQFNFDVSMMERLINNGLPNSTLAMQNRQREEFAVLLSDIYPNLKTNHVRVQHNDPPFCLAKSSFFWHHSFLENKERSVTNVHEAERAVTLALFLVQQGYQPKQVTILAMYRGQTSLIRRCLEEKMIEHKSQIGSHILEHAAENKVRVHTVDMYQGDENDFVIVSLVRSNSSKRIGFVGERNRRCVAQSRARSGLYFIGNAEMFKDHPTWKPMMSQLYQQGRVGTHLELKCKHHPLTSSLVEAITLRDFCSQPCMQKMSCDLHNCEKRCQPSHNHNACQVVISFSHSICGHDDQRKCFEDERNKQCKRAVTFTRPACGHKSVKLCHEDESTFVCKFQHLCTLSCGHTKTKKCFEDMSTIKCFEKCPLQQACGHSCEDHLCHQHASIKKCPVCKRKEMVEQERQQKLVADLKKKTALASLAEVKRLRELSKNNNKVFYSDVVADGMEYAMEYEEVVECVKKFIEPSQKWSPEITSIRKVTNYKLKIKWLQKKTIMVHPEGRSSLKFHSTKNEDVKNITKEGFRLTDVDCLYGKGVYFASEFSKDKQNSFDTSNSNKLLLCDVLLGKPLVVEAPRKDMDLEQLKILKYDSLSGKSNFHSDSGAPFEEYVVYDQHRAYPKYVIHYSKGKAIEEGGKLTFGNSFATGHKSILPSRSLKPGDPLDNHFRIAESQFLRLLRKLGTKQNHEVKQVDVYMNPELEKKFIQKQKEFGEKYGDSDEKSQYLMLFHGTKSKEIVENIMEKNFIKSTGGKFGPGVYFSEFPSYTFGYGGEEHLILAKVLPGNIYHCKGPQPLQPGYDSHGGLSTGDGRYQEIVIFDTDQILPSYVIHV